MTNRRLHATMLLALFLTVTMSGSVVAAHADPRESRSVVGVWDGAEVDIGGSQSGSGDIDAGIDPSDPHNLGPELDEPSTIRKDIRVCMVDLDAINVMCELEKTRCNIDEGGYLVEVYEKPTNADESAWITTGSVVCRYPADANVGAEDEFPGYTIEDLKSLPIAAAVSTLQPSPHTLRGAHTNMYAEATEQTFTEDIVGFTVNVIATPVAYSWNYGDGSAATAVETPGAPLPQGRWGEQTNTSHVYTETGDYPVALTTYFTGRYSVDGGPWIHIAGQAAVASEPATVSVWRAVTNNYADNCIENPQGAGC